MLDTTATDNGLVVLKHRQITHHDSTLHTVLLMAGVHDVVPVYGAPSGERTELLYCTAVHTSSGNITGHCVALCK